MVKATTTTFQNMLDDSKYKFNILFAKVKDFALQYEIPLQTRGLRSRDIEAVTGTFQAF